MPVNDQHPEYHCALPRYKLIRAIINNDAKCYIRNPDKEDMCRNEQYKDDAVLVNFTSFTLEALVGLVFSKKLKLELPPELSYLLEDATGGGINIWQFSQSAVSELIQVGRYGLLLDYNNDNGRAYIKPYCAESIINWKTGLVNGTVQPWLIVLTETVVLDYEDIFSQEMAVQYRVLIIDNGIYKQQVFNAGLEPVGDLIVPLDFEGNPFTYIPFVFLGSDDNDAKIDKEPMYDMAVLNRAHYQDSADYQESIWLNGQPYLVINVGESSAEEFAAANPSGVAYGSRRGLVLASGGSASLLQANPNQLVAQAMNDKLDQAQKIGARMIEKAEGSRETAEAARLRASSQTSSLSTISYNTSWGVEKALKILCQFMGANENLVTYKLNDQFYEEVADGNVMNSYTAWFDRGIVSADEIRDYGRRVGVINKDSLDSDIELSVDLNTDPLADAYIDNGNNTERRTVTTPASPDENGGYTG